MHWQHRPGPSQLTDGLLFFFFFFFRISACGQSPTCLIIYIRPIRTKKRRSTLRIMVFSSRGVNVERKAAFPSGSSRRIALSALSTVACVLNLETAAGSGLVRSGTDDSVDVMTVLALDACPGAKKYILQNLGNFHTFWCELAYLINTYQWSYRP